MTSPRPRRPRFRPSRLLHNPILVAWERIVYRMRDPRSIGYFVTGLVLLAVLGYSWRLWNVTQSGQQTLWVEFAHNGEAISALQDGDPVEISGVVVGRVDHIEPLDDGAKVLLEFFTWQKIRTDAKAVNLPTGLMGARGINLDRGTPSLPLLKDAGTIPGRFQPGIAETMSQIEILVGKVNAIHSQANGWIEGDSLHAPAYRRIQESFEQLRSLVGMLQGATEMAAQGGQQLAKVDGGLRVIHGGLATTGGDLDRTFAKVDPMLDSGKSLLGSVRPLVKEAQVFDAMITDSTSFLVRNLTNDSLYVQLKGANEGLRKVAGVLDGKLSLDFHFSIWRTLRFTRPERKE